MYGIRSSILAPIVAFIVGVALGYSLLPSPKPAPVTTSVSLVPETAAKTAISKPPAKTADQSEPAKPTPSDSSDNAAPVSTENLIADLKAALASSSTRRTYAAFSRATEAINEKNVRDVLGFAETLPREQDKSVLRSFVI